VWRHFASRNLRLENPLQVRGAKSMVAFRLFQYLYLLALQPEDHPSRKHPNDALQIKGGT
jgi:hypothetical protein